MGYSRDGSSLTECERSDPQFVLFRVFRVFGLGCLGFVLFKVFWLFCYLGCLGFRVRFV